MNYCTYRDVMTGKYDCNYATVVNNTVVCTSKECNHKGIYGKPVVNNSDEDRERYFKLHSGAVYGKSVYDLLANMPDEAFPF